MTSLRFRLLFGTLFWIAASVLVAGWGLGRLFHQHVSAQFHAELQTHLDQLTAHLEIDDQGRPTLNLPLGDPRFDKPFSGLYWQIDRLSEAGVPASGAALRSRSLWDQALAIPANALADGEVHQHRIIGPRGAMLGAVERSLTLEDRPLQLIVAADERLMIEPVARFKGELWLALGVLGFGLALAALLQVFVGLAPLRKLQAALGRVRDGQAQRMEGRFPSELTPLVTEFNSVLMQNAEVVARARTQAGNLAHALKTPLSVLANAADAPENRNTDLARLVAAQIETARKQVDYHLARAQAVATARLPGARTPVEPVVEGLLRTMRRIHAGRGLELHVEPMPSSLAFRGEEHDLQEMLGNLIDNACKWARSRVEIRAHDGQGRLLVSVDDDGKGVAAGQRDAILRRGVRADEQVAGTGLGLAIVGDLAHMYGGSLMLADSPLGGLRAVLSLASAR
ncbi:MAG: sensor histidine kinase [Proteobacteria bacterium]|nr:sensor histidine kinase [Pseudomonadota bacterium]